MSARKSNTQQRVEHELREERAREQPVAKRRRDSDSVLQLLASPLVSRSPSPVSEADEESTGEILDVELPSEEEDPGADATEIAEVVAISFDESGPEDASEEEEEGTETVSPDVARRAARDRMVFRRLSRATAGLGRICLGQIPPSGKPKEWARILEARAGQPQPPLPPPRSPTPPPRSPSPLPNSPSPPPLSPPRQHEWHLPQAHVAQAAEEAAEEARMREAIEAIEAIEWRRPPPLNPRDSRAKSAKRVAETADREGLEVTTEEEREAQEGLEKGPWEWPTPPETSRDTAPPPEAGAADFVPGVASLTGEADAAETAVGGRGTAGNRGPSTRAGRKHEAAVGVWRRGGSLAAARVSRGTRSRVSTLRHVRGIRGIMVMESL
ncbi:fibrous sheath CABYR-binding protein-like [Drosophila elegans]|uniref:fibrous sheath CABYR-binding protein-like n=1 Tax=Drosophila elegans TaxID=30023 RepID=UPI001BC83817|nr:fibrous sheath CABYR-binding protein-like [Drosophila elegans]